MTIKAFSVNRLLKMGCCNKIFVMSQRSERSHKGHISAEGHSELSEHLHLYKTRTALAAQLHLLFDRREPRNWISGEAKSFRMWSFPQQKSYDFFPLQSFLNVRINLKNRSLLEERLIKSVPIA